MTSGDAHGQPREGAGTEPPGAVSDRAVVDDAVPVRARRAWAKVLAPVCGVAVALVLAEGAFWWRDQGAFPHVNQYVADDALGVRLAPGGTQRFALHDNPVSDIVINPRGYRGETFPPPRPHEILVVGDSQVFGLGVDEADTFAAQLSTLTGRPVLNGGVPTYGPDEYVAVIDELTAGRTVTDVVMVINMANDLFEAGRPNRDRHAEWDGWAVRAETKPDDPVWFPFRRWLFQESHAVYALRRWWHDEDAPAQVASEGTYRDLVSTGTDRTAAQQKAHAVYAQSTEARREAETAVRTAENHAVQAMDQAYDEIASDIGALDDADVDAMEALRRSYKGPGDIVRQYFAESARAVTLTAQEIRRGVALRQRLARTWRSRRDARRKAYVEAVAAARDVRRQNRKIWARPLPPGVPESPVLPQVRQARAIAAARGAALTVVALPLDVQVSPAEFKKYGADPVDMSATKTLRDDVLAAAALAGARGLDPTAALSAAEPGAFLHGDLHLTPKGHAAFAAALAETLTTRVPAPIPAPWRLPAGRTAVPTLDEWLQEPEIIVTGSSKARCGTWQIDEWVRINCAAHPGDRILDVEVTAADRHEVLRYVSKRTGNLVAALLPGEKMSLRVQSRRGHRDLRLWAGPDGQVTGEVAALVRRSGPPPAADYAPAKKSCQAFRRRVLDGTGRGRSDRTEVQAWCDDLVAGVNPRCGSTTPARLRGQGLLALVGQPEANAPGPGHGVPPPVQQRRAPADLEELEFGYDGVRCSAGEMQGPRPRCVAGEVLAGGHRQCVRTCRQDADCDVGTCRDWPGGVRACL